jgi:hypothetical protein
MGPTEQRRAALRSGGLPANRSSGAQSRRFSALLLAGLLVLMPAWAAANVAKWANSAVRLQALDQISALVDRHEPEHRLVGAVPAESAPPSRS